MTTLFAIFQHLDRSVRMRPDAQRWRVTINKEVIELWRRPVLTSDVTLAALGIGDAPMPVPQLCCVIMADDATQTWSIQDLTHDPVQQVTATQLPILRQHIIDIVNSMYHIDE